MGFKLLIKGASGDLNFEKENITNVKFKSDTPDDSNARASELGSILEIKGKILSPVNGEEADQTKQMLIWSLVEAEKSDAYREVEVEVIAGDTVVRKINFSNAFVVDYIEDYNSNGGVGEFILVLKQKKDKLKDVKIEGGYGA